MQEKYGLCLRQAKCGLNTNYLPAPHRRGFFVSPHPIDKKALDETINHLQDAVEQSKLGYDEKSKALKRLHRATRHIEDTRAPEADLDALEKAEWKHAEKSGGMTFMGKVIPGVTKAAFKLQNSLLYGKRDGGAR